MNKIAKKITCIVFFSVALSSYAQTKGKDFTAVDAFVKKAGTLDSMTMGTITEIITKSFSDKTEKIRAIFDWIAYNISFDCKAGRTGNAQKNSTNDVLLYRKAIGIGYATLFQDMCSSADIRCLTVDGFVKMNKNDINDTKTDINHSWAVVQLGQSPEDWYYVDPAWGSGYTDADMKTFTRAYNDAYFFSDKAVFNFQHYPDNEAWKLGDAPKNKKDFYALPLIKAAAFEFGLKKCNPNNGYLKVKANKAQTFSFTMDGKGTVDKVVLLIGEPKKQKTKEDK